MANINDYIKWRGDLSFDNSEFNEVDDLILARFSYLPFYKIGFKGVKTIKAISEKFKDYKDEDFNYLGDREMIIGIGNSDRFRKLKVSDYVINNVKENEQQFSAITIHLNEKELYVSFIGTDATLVGWKEDFNLSFMSDIPAQLEALKYLRKICDKYPGTKLRIGGHSKGGNLAVYSSIYAGKKIENRIISTSNYDGPAFFREIIESDEYQRVKSKFVTYIPQGSIVGRMLEHEEEYYVVESDAKGMHQHDIYSWHVMGKELIKLDHLDEHSEFFNDTLNEYLKNTTPEERKIFVDNVYKLLDTTDAVTTHDFKNEWNKNIPVVMKSYKELNDEDKKALSFIIKEFGKAAIDTYKEFKIINNEDNFINKIKRKTENEVNKIKKEENKTKKKVAKAKKEANKTKKETKNTKTKKEVKKTNNKKDVKNTKTKKDVKKPKRK